VSFSSGRKKRPIAGLIPSVLKYPLVTRSPNTRFGPELSLNVITIGCVYPAVLLKTKFRAA
jgi:hypothetical protein